MPLSDPADAGTVTQTAEPVSRLTGSLTFPQVRAVVREARPHSFDLAAAAGLRRCALHVCSWAASAAVLARRRPPWAPLFWRGSRPFWRGGRRCSCAVAAARRGRMPVLPWTDSLLCVDPSKPHEPSIDQGRSIPRSRPGNDEVLEGEIIGKDEPLGRPGAVPPRPPEPPKRGLGFRKTLLLVVAVVAMGLCLGGSITAYVLYDKATQPDRSTPEGVLEQYLNAKFNTRDDARAGLFKCSSSDLADVDKALEDIEQLERKYSASITVRPASFDVSSAGNEATVNSVLHVVIPEASGVQSTLEQNWRFELKRDSSWRLCRAKKIL